MYCPHCAQPSPEDRKFCKYCGTNLGIVSQALAQRSEPPKSLSGTTAKILDDWFGSPPEPPPEKRQLNDIRAGVITTFVGVGISAFLYFFMQAVAQTQTPDKALIIQAIWLSGLIPFFIGIGLIINGLFFYRPLERATPQPLKVAPAPSPDTQRTLSDPGIQVPLSVTEHTTVPLQSPAPVRLEREGESERRGRTPDEEAGDGA